MDINLETLSSDVAYQLLDTNDPNYEKVLEISAQIIIYYTRWARW